MVGVIRPFIDGISRKVFAVVGVIIFILVGVVSNEPGKKEASANSQAGSNGSMASPTPEQLAAVTPPKPLAPIEPASKWAYSDSKDEMRGTTTKYAIVDSENAVDLEFPYGSVRGHLQIRKRSADGLTIMFSVDKGQILCHNYSESYISAKFDDGGVQRFSCTSAADGSADVAFIEAEGRFLSKLRSAKRTIIEAPFYQQGNQQFIFETKDLEWK
ncbi:MAG: hypothetical protein V4618_13440 [Pseudomonadota bacterium]